MSILRFISDHSVPGREYRVTAYTTGRMPTVEYRHESKGWRLAHLHLTGLIAYYLIAGRDHESVTGGGTVRHFAEAATVLPQEAESC